MIIVVRVVPCWFLFLFAGYAPVVAQINQDGTPPSVLTSPWSTPLGLMQHTADQIKTPVDRVRALATIAASLKNAGQNEMAQATRIQMRMVLDHSQAAKTVDYSSMAGMLLELSTDETSEETLLSTLIGDGDFVSAIRIATRVRSNEQRIRMLRQVFDAVMTRDTPTFARQAALELQRSGAGDDAFLEISQSRGMKFEKGEAFELVSLVKSPESKVQMLLQFALAWAESGNRSAVVDTMRQAQSLLIEIHDEETCTYLAYEIASILMAAGERQAAIELLQQPATPIERTRGSLLIVEMLLKSGEVDSAFDWARQIEVPADQATAFMRVAIDCSNSDDSATLKLAIEQVVSILPFIRKRNIRSLLSHQVARIQSEIGRSDVGLALLEEERQEVTQLTAAAARAIAYCELAVSQSRVGASDLSRESLTSANNELPNVTSAFLQAFVLGRIASTESLMNDPARFQSALAAAHEATDEIDDGYKRVIVLQDLSRQLHAVGRTAEAKDLFEKTQSALLKWRRRPEFVHYFAHRSVAVAFRTLGEINHSERMLRDQHPPHGKLGPDRLGKLFDVAIQSTMQGEDQETRRMLQQAVIAIREIENASLRSSMLHAVAAEFIALGNTARGSALLSEAVAATAAIEYESELTGILAAITAQTCLIRDNEMVSPILDSVLAVGAMRKSPLLEAAVMTQVASAKITYGEQGLALDLLTKASEKGASSSDALNNVAQVQYEAKQGELSTQTLNQAVDMALEHPPGRYRDALLARTVETLVRVGQNEQAIQLAQQIDYADALLSELSVGLVRNGKPELAVDVVLEIEDATQRRQALGFVGSQLDRAKHAELVEKVATALETSVKSDKKPMMGINSPTCQAATALTLAGHYERAHELVRRVRPTEVRRRMINESEIVQGVITRLVRAGELKAALNFVLAAPERAYLEKDLTTFAHQLADVGKFHLAVSVMDEVTDQTSRIWGLTRISDICFQAGKTDQARIVVHKVIGIANSSKKRAKHSAALNNLIPSLLNAQEFDFALEVNRLIEDPQVHTNAISSIALALAQSGDSEKAHKLIAELLKTVPNHDVARLYRVASAAADAGDGKRALQILEQLQKAKGDQPSSKFDVQTRQSWLEADALEDVAVSLSRMGESDQALSLVERIESAQSRDDVRLEIAYELIEKGLFEQAADVGGVEKFDKMSARMRRVLESSSIELNKVSLNKARAMAMEIPAQSEQREVFVAIARSFALMGELDLAMETACQVGAEDISRFEIAVAFATAPMEPEYPDKPVQRRLKESFTEPEIALVNRFAEMTLKNRPKD